jgi:hypothetical protein
VGGVVRGLAFIALLIAIILFGATAFLLLEQLQPREEYALSSESPTGMMPFDRIQKEQIEVYSDRAIIDVRGLLWANFSTTGSMLPVLGPSAHALQIIPKSAGEIQVGDIVSYRIDSRVIIHRVIKKGADENGDYFITKGDNNAEQDPFPVRFSQIDRVVVGILY